MYPNKVWKKLKGCSAKRVDACTMSEVPMDILDTIFGTMRVSNKHVSTKNVLPLGKEDVSNMDADTLRDIGRHSYEYGVESWRTRTHVSEMHVYECLCGIQERSRFRQCYPLSVNFNIVLAPLVPESSIACDNWARRSYPLCARAGLRLVKCPHSQEPICTFHCISL